MKEKSKTINVRGIVSHIQRKHGNIDKEFEWIDRKTIEFVLKAFCERTLSLVRNGHNVSIPKFGVFYPGTTVRRVYKTPDGNTGKGGKKVVKFKVSPKYYKERD